MEVEGKRKLKENRRGRKKMEKGSENRKEEEGAGKVEKGGGQRREETEEKGVKMAGRSNETGRGMGRGQER